MVKLPFWKLQSIGNDFPLFRLEELTAAFPVGDIPFARLAIAASDRRFGIGGDGILVLDKEGEDKFRLRMFNPDGTEDFCGNGIRCAAWYAYLIGWTGYDFNILHLDRVVPCSVLEPMISSTIGVADYTPEKVPHKAGELFNQTVWSGMDSGMPLSLFGSALTTGSTHVVIPTSVLPDDDGFASISAKIEVDPLYPSHTSVIWSREASDMKLEIRIWERSVGETQGCGTGSSAAAVDYLRRKKKGGTVEVVNPGGTLHISMEAWDQPITIVGQAEMVFYGLYSFV